MINIIPSTTTFRRVPHQSGVYQLDLDITLNNHNNDVEFFLSGGGSRFFSFGSNSGNYFASGSSKVYFEATTPNIQRTYSFVIGSNSFDVYNQDEAPLILGASKTTGIFERIYVGATVGAAGEFEVLLKGQKPSFNITNGMVFSIFQNYNTFLQVENETSTPFNILSGSFNSIGNVSGINQLPVLINSLSTVNIPFSGRLNSLGNQSTLLTVNSDFIDSTIVLNLTGTSYSGSGYIFTAPLSITSVFGNSSNASFTIKNTGTETITFQPQISGITQQILIGVPTYSGVPLKNLLRGHLDTTNTFYFSDHINWTGGNFNIIQQSQTGVNILSVSGDKTPSVSDDTFVGLGTTGHKAFGQSFRLTHDYELTGINLHLGYNSSFSPLSGSDAMFVRIHAGIGTTGALLSESQVIPGSTLPSFQSGASGFFFPLPTSLSLISGNNYSFLLTGNSSWVTSSANKFVYIQESSGFYISGFEFYVNQSDTTFVGVESWGNLVFEIMSFPPIGANRYFVNVTDGNYNRLATVDSGNYDKYMASQSFVFQDSSIESLPNELKYFTMTYTGVVSGINVANLKFLNTTYNNLISGETF